MLKKGLSILVFGAMIFAPTLARAQSNFNPNFIISDAEVQDSHSWSRDDVQQFLNLRGSFLRTYTAPDASGTPKSAADIIYEAGLNYNINPKFILTTLQKEQSLVTDDSPTQKQLDWAAGYAVCDSCTTDDPGIQSHKGFGNQVDNAAGIIRWYYDNTDKSFVKKKDVATTIDNTPVTPQSWATAFLYTYTPHLHGNTNFWRIWETWFGQTYPNGTILKSASSSEYWLLVDKTKRQFKNMTALITRADPKLAITVPDADLANYTDGPIIAFPNYSILKSANTTYLLDYDTLRPFASDEVVRAIGYNPDEIIDVTDTDITGYVIGTTITTSSTAPAGVIYKIAELKEPYFYVKDGIAKPIEKQIIDANFKKLTTEKHTLADLQKLTLVMDPVDFQDGTLLYLTDINRFYVVENGKKRPIADRETFNIMGYKKTNALPISMAVAARIADGEQIFLNSSLLSSKEKFLGDSEAPVADIFKSSLPAYLIAEYPTGRIVAGKNIDTKFPIASLTKMLTAYEALNQNFDLKKSTVYSTKKYASEGNVLKLKNGEKILNEDALASMLAISNNDLARLIAQNSGPSSENAFIQTINDRLADWGADSTQIVEPTGLDPKNISTPRDLLKIFVNIMKNDIIKTAINRPAYTFKAIYDPKIGRRKIVNTNLLYTNKKLPYDILASKTGYINEVGANLLMLVQDKKTKKQYVVITLAEKNYTKRFVEPDRLAKMLVSGQIKLANLTN
ncbi:MAG: hypothetical protein A2261_02420 [Candidatus Magasanikbacteria bacterium RIFOXYA2_FULL_44_8]|uniref:Peptidase S11 D-alanyl-D-alanine carboxypeptidase A N-terminal domain-containing protein n=1 Tax=Candidatus Magasanikbacteria bacterium RIFOXYA2_FULL_44_8 TaxID=1798696 RepID=A0A1F6NL75_9BACT|nr:MAG: hypothetical protein A2261_02420 [Candidatus Magasanikbacteria bacterium RIFOXYA2_FULL_44_8]